MSKPKQQVYSISHSPGSYEDNIVFMIGPSIKNFEKLVREKLVPIAAKQCVQNEKKKRKMTEEQFKNLQVGDFIEDNYWTVECRTSDIFFKVMKKNKTRIRVIGVSENWNEFEPEECLSIPTDKIKSELFDVAAKEDVVFHLYKKVSEIQNKIDQMMGTETTGNEPQLSKNK